MTKALFDSMPYERSFKAIVISCEKREDDYGVVLDQTLFFPEQGGQTSDIGTLDGIKVKDVQVKDGIITHFVEDEIATGKEVEGEIDWTHRFNNMQQHSGEHVFTGLAHNKYGAENVGFHLSDNTVTLDLNIDLSASQIRELELEANDIISRDLEIKCYYPDKETLDATEYRSKKEIDGAVRLVEIDGVDICACCAPHVKSTAQIGILKVTSFEKYKGGVRVYILCGHRALADYSRLMELVASTYKTLNCPEEEIANRSKAILEEAKGLRLELSNFKQEQLLNKIEMIPSLKQDVLMFTKDLDASIMRTGVNALVEKHNGLCAIFNGDDEAGYNFILGSSTRDCAAIAAGLRELLGAKGGGSKQMSQGSVSATRTEIERVLI